MYPETLIAQLVPLSLNFYENKIPKSEQTVSSFALISYVVDLKFVFARWKIKINSYFSESTLLWKVEAQTIKPSLMLCRITKLCVLLYHKCIYEIQWI